MTKAAELDSTHRERLDQYGEDAAKNWKVGTLHRVRLYRHPHFPPVPGNGEESRR